MPAFTRLGLLALLVWLIGSFAVGQEWDRFRGPNGAGIALDTVIPKRWTDKDYRWKLKLPGLGHSSPVLWGQRLFVTSGDVKTKLRFVTCIDAAGGRILWTRTFPGPVHRQHEHNSWASGSPAVDERGLYVPFASEKDYLIVALDHKGSEQWKKELGPYKSGHGFGSSVIVIGQLVIVPQEHEGQSRIVALDRDDGAIRWTLPRKSRMTYATPCLYSPKDGPAQMILGNYEHGVTAVDPGNGKVLWEIDVFDKGHIETSIASPIVAGDLVIGCSGWLGVRKEVIAVGPPSAGEKPKVAYRLHKGMPLVPTPLVRNDLLFAWGDEGVVTCADARTGKVHWQERVEGEYYSSPICVGDRLVNVARNGEVVILAASKRFEQLGHNSLGEGSHATPAVAEHSVFFRSFHHLIALPCKPRE